MRASVLEVNLNNFLHNVEQIQNYVGKDIKLMPVVKANGYGSHINMRLDILNKFDIVAVALVDEAVNLRSIGYTKEIFVLNQPCSDEIDLIVENNITIGLSDLSFLDELSKRRENVKVHIEVDTGMGRTGVINLDEFIFELKKCSNVIV